MTSKLPCPKCGGNQVHGVSTRKACLNGHFNSELQLLPEVGIKEGIKRRRRCLDCHWIFNTIEIGVDELNVFLKANAYMKDQLAFKDQQLEQLREKQNWLS